MATRRMTVEVIGDADSYTRAAKQAVQAGNTMQKSFSDVGKAQSRMTASAAQSAVAIGRGFSNAAYGGARALEQFGDKLSVAGRAGGFLSSVLSGDLVGGIKSLQKVVDDSAESLRGIAESAQFAGSNLDKLTAVLKDLGASGAAAELRAIRNEAVALAAVDFGARQFNVSGPAPVSFRGSPDDRGGIRGPALAGSILIPSDLPTDAELKVATDAFANVAEAIGQMRAQALRILEQEKARRAALRKAAEEARRQKFADIATDLSLGVERAELTATLNDDVVALQALEAGLKRQVAAGVEVRSAQGQLLQVQQDIARTQQEIRDRAAEAARQQTQARQFRSLGLSETGDEIVPGIKNLQKRIDGALRRVTTGELDVSSKLVERLRLARNLIKKEGGKLTEDTRDTINDLILTVTRGAKKLDGPLTKTTGLNTKKLLQGLGLSPEDERELRQRLSGFNSAGIARAGANTNRPNGQFVGGPQQPVTVNTTVQMDDQVVGRSVTKVQQKDKRRNPKAKRGPRSGI